MAGELELFNRVREFIGRGPFFFYDILRQFPDAEYRDLLRVWARLRSQEKFDRDEEGRYLLNESRN